MTHHTINVTLDTLADTTVFDMVETAHHLSLTEYQADELIATCSAGTDILDGYHRASGLVAWALDEGLDLAQTTVPVIDVLDDAMIDALADLGPGESRGNIL